MKRLLILAGLAASLIVVSPAHAQCQSNTWPPSAGTCVTRPYRSPVIIAPTLNVQQNTLVQNTLIEINTPPPVFYVAAPPPVLDMGGADYVIQPAVSLPATTWWDQPAATPCRGLAAHDVGCSGR